MLPFLKKMQEGSASMPVDAVKREPDNEEEFDDLGECCGEILSAIERKDRNALKESLKSFFDICDSSPHEEGEHLG